MSREAGSLDRHFSQRELDCSMVPKTAWCGQKGGEREAGLRGESPSALGFNSVVPLLLCLSLEKNKLPQEKIHFFTVT